MAQWYRTKVTFTGVTPSPEDLVKLNRAAKALDYDCPEITDKGMEGEWRNPLVPFKNLLDLLRYAGFPCEGSCFHIFEGENLYVSGTLENSLPPDAFTDEERKTWDEAYLENVSPGDRIIEEERTVRRGIKDSFVKLKTKIQEHFSIILMGDVMSHDDLKNAIASIDKIIARYEGDRNVSNQ